MTVLLFSLLRFCVLFSSQPVPCFFPADVGLVSALLKCVYANQYSRRFGLKALHEFLFISVVNFRCFYFYRRLKIHLSCEKVHQRDGVKYEMGVPVDAFVWQRCLLL